MNASELRQLTVEKLEAELLALRREGFNLRMQAGSGQMPRPNQFSEVRKNIARVKTVLTERQRSESNS